VKKVLLIAVVLIVLGAMVAFPRMKFHFIRSDGGGGEVLWKSDEAYLFLYDRPVGYHLSGGKWLAEPVNEYFNAPAIPDDDANFLAILHVTPSEVERHMQKSKIGIDSFTPLGDAIYASCPGGICKWTGTQFELITSQAEQKMGGSSHLSSDWNEFSDANGWSKRAIRATEPGQSPIHNQFSIDLNKQLKILVIEGNPASVDLQRPNQSTERVWYHKQGTSLVSRAKYDHVFGPR
jgi:hypothetical protein